MTTRLLLLPALLCIPTGLEMAFGHLNPPCPVPGKRVEVAPTPRPAVIRIPLDRGKCVQSLCLSPNNRLLYAALRDDESGAVGIYAWNLETRRQQYLIGLEHAGDVQFSWVRSGRTLVVAQRVYDGTGRVVWLDVGEKPDRSAVRAELTAGWGVRYEEWNDDRDDITKFVYHKGRYVGGPVTATTEGVFLFGSDDPRAAPETFSLRLVPFADRAAPAQEFRLPKNATEVQLNTLALSADGSTAALCMSGQEPGLTSHLWVYDAKSGKLTVELSYEATTDFVGSAHSLAVSRDGSWLVTAPGRGPAQVFDLKTQAQTHTTSAGRILALASSPTDSVFVLATRREIEAWSFRSGKRLAAWKLDDTGDTPVAFSPDGTRLIWGNRAIHITEAPGDH